MKFLKVFLSILTTSFLLSASLSANAAIITFDDVPSDYRYQNLPSYTEGEFNMSVKCSNCVNVFSTTEPLSGYGASVGAIGWGADGRFLETWNTSAVFILSHVDSKAFNFNSFNIGWFENSTQNASWRVRTFDKQGAQIGADDVYTGKGLFDTNYIGVYSVQFQNNGGLSSFDNLNVTVSAPSIAAMLVLFIVALGFRSNRKFGVNKN